MFNKWKQPSCHSLSAWGSSEGLSQVSSAVKDREGEAEHRFMQNMTRLPSYFTLACLGGKWPQETELRNRSGLTWRNETLLGKPSRTRSGVFFNMLKNCNWVGSNATSYCGKNIVQTDLGKQSFKRLFRFGWFFSSARLLKCNTFCNSVPGQGWGGQEAGSPFLMTSSRSQLCWRRAKYIIQRQAKTNTE